MNDNVSIKNGKKLAVDMRIGSAMCDVGATIGAGIVGGILTAILTPNPDAQKAPVQTRPVKPANPAVLLYIVAAGLGPILVLPSLVVGLFGPEDTFSDSMPRIAFLVMAGVYGAVCCVLVWLGRRLSKAPPAAQALPAGRANCNLNPEKAYNYEI